MKRKKKEIDKTISDLWNRIWDLQDQTNKIKKAVLTGEKGDLKMPERRIVPPDEPIPFGGTVDMDCISGSWDEVEHTYTVESLTADSGWVDIRATYLENLSISKRFTIAKQYAGEQGTAGRTYFINADADILLMGADKKINDSASDIRLKENVLDCEINALDAVCKMPVCSFDWKETGVHQPLGLVADDIEKIDPLLTLGGGENEDGSMNVKQIDRLLLTEYAIKAIQELSAVVKEQSRKIRKLEEKLDGIKGN